LNHESAKEEGWMGYSMQGVYGEGVGKPGLLNRVAGEAVRVNELKLITVRILC